MTCLWRQCGGKIWDYGEKAFPRYRCLSCGRSDDLEWEKKKAILQALADQKQRFNHAKNRFYGL